MFVHFSGGILPQRPRALCRPPIAAGSTAVCPCARCVVCIMRPEGRGMGLVALAAGELWGQAGSRGDMTTRSTHSCPNCRPLRTARRHLWVSSGPFFGIMRRHLSLSLRRPHHLAADPQNGGEGARHIHSSPNARGLLSEVAPPGEEGTITLSCRGTAQPAAPLTNPVHSPCSSCRPPPPAPMPCGRVRHPPFPGRGDALPPPVYSPPACPHTLCPRVASLGAAGGRGAHVLRCVGCFGSDCSLIFPAASRWGWGRRLGRGGCASAVSSPVGGSAVRCPSPPPMR